MFFWGRFFHLYFLKVGNYQDNKAHWIYSFYSPHTLKSWFGNGVRVTWQILMPMEQLWIVRGHVLGERKQEETGRLGRKDTEGSALSLKEKVLGSHRQMWARTTTIFRLKKRDATKQEHRPQHLSCPSSWVGVQQILRPLSSIEE